MLENYLDEINGLDPMSQKLNYNIDNWENGIENIELQLIHQNFNGCISRQGLFNYCNENHLIEYKFLAIMMWGYGGGDNLRSAGYGPFRVNRIMVNGVLNILPQVINYIDNGELFRALENVVGVDNFGISFASKTLYFLSLHAPNRGYILDLRVARSINHLTGNFPQSSLHRNPIQTYQNYQNILDNWANDYNLQKDKIELFLFLKNGFQDLAVIEEEENMGDVPQINNQHNGFDQISPNSRYHNLSQFFRNCEQNIIELDSDDMAEIIGGLLPNWAFNPNSAFWSNASYNDHRHRLAWLGNNFLVNYRFIDQNNKYLRVGFKRINL